MESAIMLFKGKDNIIRILKLWVSNHASYKWFIHRLMYDGRPRWWVKHILNPVFFSHGSHSWIRKNTVLNIYLHNKFYVGSCSGIEEFSVIDNGVGDVIIGNHTLIGSRNTLIGPVNIGNNVILAQNVVLSGINHRYQLTEVPIRDQGFETKDIQIDDDSWIGANVTVLAGVHIGKHVVIGAGSVVTKDVPDFSVAVGNPARVIKQIEAYKNTKSSKISTL